jgi:hypothetical protein
MHLVALGAEQAHRTVFGQFTFDPAAGGVQDFGFHRLAPFSIESTAYGSTPQRNRRSGAKLLP